ncbi:hypothetical protein [Pedobacter sp.]|uniref:hypothetical protein n=1 Tax=Pedobacter sp. TaxID=1411316 RepID=UPI0031D8455B
MKPTTFKTEILSNIIAYYQIIGGLYGLYGTVSLLAKEPTVSGLGLLFYTLMIALFSLSIYCGNLLRIGKTKGLALSKWNQLAQVIQINLLGVAFQYISGVGISFGYAKTGDFIQFIYMNVSSFYIKYNLKESEEFYFYINIIPLIIFYFIEKIEAKIKMENIAQEKISDNRYFLLVVGVITIPLNCLLYWLMITPPKVKHFKLNIPWPMHYQFQFLSQVPSCTLCL